MFQTFCSVISYVLCNKFQIEGLVLECPFPKSVLNVTLTPTQGKYSFDPTTKVLTWEVGRLDPTKVPNIKGTVSLLSISSTNIHHY